MSSIDAEDMRPAQDEIEPDWDDRYDDEEGPEATREELASEVTDLRQQVANLQRMLTERVVSVVLMTPDHEHTTMTQHALVLQPGVTHRLTVAGVCTEVQRAECGTDKRTSIVQVDLGVTLQ